jgi:glycosyltransferase involved in cell wall biosynthesis
MGAESTVKFTGEQPFRIPFNSRAFLSKGLYPDPSIKKHWDIINVSRNAHVKRLDVFLMAIRKLYDLGYNYKVLLVVPSTTIESPSTHHIDIVEKYDMMFNKVEKNNFTLLRLSRDLGFLGISPSTIEYFYKSSKIFNLLSSAEGESRVIHEALLCGLPIVCYSGLLGGGRDYLNSENSIQFDDYNKVHESFIEGIENYSKYNVDADHLANQLREDKTLKQLKTYFSELYNNFDGELINTDELCLRLPGHYLDVPWNIGRENSKTADIRSIEQLKLFVGELS